MAAQQPDATRPGEIPTTVPAFETVWRGFDQEQVRAHLHLISGRLEELGSRLDRTQALLEEARRERDLARAASTGSFEGVSSYVADLVHRFDQDVENLQRQAQAEAAGIVAEARTEADHLRTKAQLEEREARTRADELLRAAREDAEALKRDLEPVREATMIRIREMRDRLASSVRELEQVLQGKPSVEPVVVIGEAEPASAPAPADEREARPGLAM